MNFSKVDDCDAMARRWPRPERGDADPGSRTGSSNRFEAQDGKPAILGIRPEGLRMANGGDPADMSFEGVVEVAEQLGSEIILDLNVGGAPMVASVEPTVRVRHGEKIRLAIDPDGLRFFDSVTERAL